MAFSHFSAACCRWIHTTEEELEGYFIVRAILRDLLDAERVTYRDGKTYFSVFLDDNNRKPICQLWFNTRQKYLALFDAKKKRTRVPIDSLDGIYEHAEALRARAEALLALET